METNIRSQGGQPGNQNAVKHGRYRKGGIRGPTRHSSRAGRRALCVISGMGEDGSQDRLQDALRDHPGDGHQH